MRWPSSLHLSACLHTVFCTGLWVHTYAPLCAPPACPHTVDVQVICTCVSAYSMCVSGARVVTHSDCEPRPLAGEACGSGRSLQGSEAALQLGSAPLVVAGLSPCHTEEVFRRTPYWEASSVKTGQCHYVLLLAAMFAPQ